MKIKTLFNLLAVSFLVLALGTAHQAQAQGPGAQDDIVPLGVSLGTGFTYQGRLTDNSGNPIAGPCNLRFTLYQSATGNDPVGAPLTANGVTTDNGYFSVNLDFGAAAFTGDGRFLKIEVDCGGGYTTLDPRVKLTPAPYAMYSVSTGALRGNPVSDNIPTAGDVLAWDGNSWMPTTSGVGNAWSLTGNSSTTAGTNFVGTSDNVALEFKVNGARALRLEPNTTSPNLIGGYSGNSVTAGVYGATIGGGGRSGDINHVTGNYATVGGGVDNTASGDATVGGGTNNTASSLNATVGGGLGNTASNDYATVGGGDSNTASSDYATIGGGSGNTASDGASTIGGGLGNSASGGASTISGGDSNSASSFYTTVGGGQGNAASGNYSYVGGGDSNSASGGASTIGGGNSNSASGSASTIGGGNSNAASATSATVGGGYLNTASGIYATVPGGVGAAATLYGQMAYASGQFANQGDAQSSLYVMRNATSSSGTWENLYLNGWNTLLTIAPNRTLTFDILVVGRSNVGESAGYYIWGVAENVGGTTTVWATTMVINEDDANWDAQAVADDANDALLIQVMGNGETIRWVATVRTAEVAW